MKRLLAAFLLVASPVLAQAENGWVEIENGWGEIQTPPGTYATLPAPTGCASTEVAYFLGTPPYMACMDQVYWTAATRSLDVTDGRVQAANLTAIPLATPAGITVTPVLSQIGAITVVAGAALADGDALSVGDGTGIVPIEFDASPGDGTTGGAIPIIFDGTETATQIRDAVKAILDAAGRDWTTSNQGADGIGLVRATPGATGGAITEAVTNAGFSVTDWTDPTHATTVTYQLVACLADGSCTQAGVDSTTAVSTATLSASNFLRLSWSAVPGAATYKVYRKVAPTSPATTGVVYTGTALTVDDTGIAGSGATAPTSNGTGVVTGARFSPLNVTRATPYAFALFTRSDQPTYSPVQLDVDSGGLVISPQTGAGLLSKTVGLEIAKLDGAGVQQFSMAFMEDGVNTAASTYRIRNSTGASYLPLAVKQIVTTANGAANDVAVVLGGAYGTGLFLDGAGTSGVATSVGSEKKFNVWGSAGVALVSLQQDTARLTFGTTADAEINRAAANRLATTGGFTLGSAARPTCDATTRGTLWYVAGGAGVADTIEICGKSAADTYSWVALATF